LGKGSTFWFTAYLEKAAAEIFRDPTCVTPGFDH
jgi:hypothetical protein